MTNNTNETFHSTDQVMPLIEKIIKTSFPELANIKIQLGTVNKDSVFLESRPVIHSLFLPMKVQYKITINPALIELKLPLLAVEGILAHELAHTAFYVNKGRFQTMLTGFVFLNHDKHVAFERSTDIDAITRGYGEGIKAYRELAFINLNEAQLATKKQRYYWSNEIDALLAAYKTHPDLRKVWLKTPPTNLEEITTSINAYIANINGSA